MEDVLQRSSYALGEPWFFGLILACLALLAVVHNVYPARIPNLVKATFNERITRQIMREEMVFSHRASWLLLLISAATFSAVAILFLRGIGQDVGASEFFYILLGVSAWIILRQLMRALMAVLCHKDFGFKEFNYVSASIFKLQGVILLPLAILMAYLPSKVGMYFGYLALLILVLAAGYRLLRGWWIGRYHTGGSFYMIFYLCALELIPTLVLIRALFTNIESL